MSYNPLYNEIFGESEPERTPIQPIPFIDDVDTGVRYTPRSNPRLDKALTEERLREIFGKNEPAPIGGWASDTRAQAAPPENRYSPANRTRVTSDGSTQLDPVDPDPRVCSCRCPFCLVTGDHANCCGEPRCWLSHPDLIDHQRQKPTNDNPPAEGITADFLMDAVRDSISNGVRDEMQKQLRQRSTQTLRKIIKHKRARGESIANIEERYRQFAGHLDREWAGHSCAVCR